MIMYHCLSSITIMGGIVLLVVAAKVSLTLSFDCERDDKPGLID